jgi:hypothetical protein
MTLSATLAIALVAGSPVSPELCSGVDNKIEPDMRILESDLTQLAAIEASDKLRAMIERGDLGGEFQFGALNQSKIIYGHILLRQARTDSKEFGLDSAESRDSARALCTWLNSEGFWHD